VTLAQLNDWYVLPEGADNAADLYMEAFACLVEWDREAAKSLPAVGSGILPEPNEPPDEEICALMQDYLTDNAESLAWLKQAAQLEHTRYPVDFGEGLIAPMPWLRDVRNCIRLYAVQMLLAIETGDKPVFMESFSGAAGLVSSMSQMPSQTGQLVRIACTGVLTTSLKRALSCLRFTEQELVSLSALLASHSDVTLLMHGTAGQVCLLADSLRFPRVPIEEYVGVDSPIPGLLIKPYRALGLAERDLVEYLELARDMLPETAPTAQTLLEAGRALERKRKAIPQTHWLFHVIAPAWERVGELHARYYAGLGSAQMALAVLRYRLQHQRLPDSLDDLMPEFIDAVPIDPFGGQALRYRRQVKGFVIYSVGVDGLDNGGSERDRKDRDKNYDLPFAVDFSGRARE